MKWCNKPHSRSGRAHAFELRSQGYLMNPSPLTGERLAIAQGYRYAFFFIDPDQRVLQFGPASGSN